jgi:DNA-binding NarL/FixJ family response regulator
MTAIFVNSSLLGVEGSAPAPAPRHHSRERGIHVLLADDHRATSYHIWALLSAQSDVREVSTGESVEEVLSLAAQHAFDLVMVSPTFGGSHGFSLAYRLEHLPQALPVLIYVNPVDSRLAGAAMIAGADGVIDPKKGATELANLLGRIATGAQAFSALEPDPFHELADRVDEDDRRIVGMLLLRLAPDEIANLLGISARSFRARREAIVRHLDAGCAEEHPEQRDVQLRAWVGDLSRPPRIAVGRPPRSQAAVETPVRPPRRAEPEPACSGPAPRPSIDPRPPATSDGWGPPRSPSGSRARARSREIAQRASAGSESTDRAGRRPSVRH